MVDTDTRRAIFVSTMKPPSILYRSALAALLLLVSICLPGVSRAAQVSGVINLDQAIQMALDYSPNLKAAMQDVNKAEYGRKEAFTYYLPELSTSYSWRRVQTPAEIKTSSGDFTVGSKNNYIWSTGFTQPLFTGWRITSTYRLAELGVDLARVNLSLARLDVVLKVKEAYFVYLRSLKDVAVRKLSVKLLQSQLKTSQDFYDVGIIPINDVLKTKVELSQAQQNLVSADNQAAVNLTKLNNLLGRPVNQPIEVEDILKHFPVDITYESARAQALAQRPELKALDLKLKQADQSIRKAQSGYWPELAVRGSYDFDSDSPELGDSVEYDATGWSVVAGLEWTFWEWGRTKHQVDQQRAGKLKLKALHKDMEDQVDLQVKQSYLFLQEADKNIATAKISVEQAKENYRITRERYKEQLTTNTELLDAQTLLTQAQNNYYTTLTVYNVAYANLLRSMGREK